MIDLTARIKKHARTLSKELDANMREQFLPDQQKVLRRFSSAEVADLLGITQSWLRKQHADGRLPEVEVDGRGRRFYTAAEIHSIRRILAETSRSMFQYLPGRGPGNDLKIIALGNFKGGSAKTTVSCHLAHKLALDGYRVLAIDFDPQGSFTTMFGYRPEIDFMEEGTIYDALRYDDPQPLSSIIRKTYFHNIDLAPAGLILSEYETETAYALTQSLQPPFFQRLSHAISTVEADYDVVVIDCPPSLGFLTLTALMAATGLIVTVVPGMLDIASMAQFLTLSGSLLEELEQHGVRPNFDFMCYMITQFEPSSGPQAQMAGFLRSILGADVMTSTFLKSVAISDAAMTQDSLYEVPRSAMNRNTYDRAMESVNSVMGEVEAMIQTAWGRS